jgi:prefoldin subunit 5
MVQKTVNSCENYQNVKKTVNSSEKGSKKPLIPVKKGQNVKKNREKGSKKP